MIWHKNYSEAEFKLFHSLGLADLMESLQPPALYRVAVEQAFLKAMNGPNIEALRRGANAILGSRYTYRMTPEFDDLLKW